jgi:predicted SAM-dependent methyltransferase
MTLGRLIRQLARGRTPSVEETLNVAELRRTAVEQSVNLAADPSTPRVLNVGGNSKAIPIPKHYDGWAHLLLDIDPTGEPDIVCDARTMTELPAAQFDAVYCSHNLEHYYRHDGRRVLQGFRHVLKPHGFAEIRVPDILEVMKTCIEGNLDIDDFLYQSPAGPIRVHDVIYGWGKEIEESGQDFFAHKAGFTAKSLTRFLEEAGFAPAFIAERLGQYEIRALAFKQAPTEHQRRLLGL